MDSQPCLEHNDYTVGWICALPAELTAAMAMLDERHLPLKQHRADHNTYTLGRVGEHNVVIACLPGGQIGNNSAATVATQMRYSFGGIRFGLMVGIGGGVPNTSCDIRLGDVVVSKPGPQNGGVIQYDFGKTITDGRFVHTKFLNSPPTVLLTALNTLQAEHVFSGNRLIDNLKAMDNLQQPSKFEYQGAEHDLLFQAEYDHVGGGTACEQCDVTKLVVRPPREGLDPVIHYGTIASGNQVMRHGATRDRLRQEFGVLCFEMEAAGLVNDFPCVVIRGICDYADSHKNKRWQEYAAATAAAFAKELLNITPTDQPATAVVTIDRASLRHSWSIEKYNDRNLFDWLSSYDHASAHYRLSSKRLDGTGIWILQNDEFNRWWKSTSASVWCSGIPGAGKTTLTTVVVEKAKELSEHKFPVAYIYCDQAELDTLTASSVLQSFVKQLLFHLNDLRLPWPSPIRDKLDRNFQQSRKTLFPDELTDILLELLSCYNEAVFFVDGLDECAPKESDQILHSLERMLCEQSVELRIFISSRKEMDVSRFLPGCLHISVSKESIEPDICLYVERAVEINIVKKGLASAPSVIQDIKASLIKGSQGMFLWVELQIEAISADCNSDEEIQEALRSLPTTLAEIYTRCLLRISRRPGDLHLAPKILKWVAFANHPLGKDEIKEAIAFGLEDKTWKSSKVPNNISSCGNLLVLDDGGAVRLAHSTVRQFLLSEKQPDSKVVDIPLEKQTRILEKFNFKREQAELEIGEGCVTYLSLSDFDAQLLRITGDSGIKVSNIVPPVASVHSLGGPVFGRLLTKAFPRSSQVKKTLVVPQATTVLSDSFPKYKLLNYARTHWASHTTHITEKSPVWVKFKSLALIPNFSWKLQPWLKDDFSNAIYYKSLLQWAISAEHIPLLGLFDSLPSGSKLPDLSKQLLLNGELPLNYAAGNNRAGAVRFLLRDFKVNAKDKNGETALHYAARQGHKAVVKALLEARDIKVDARSNSKSTPLQIAAYNGHIEIAQLLLAKGADVDAKDVNGNTVLHGVISSRNRKFLQTLLPRVSIKPENMTLHAAVSSGNLEAILRALHGGADPEAKGRTGCTAFHWAAKNGYEAAVWLLLEMDNVDPNSKDSNGWTPLMWAAGNGHEAVVKLLLDKDGIDLNSKDSDVWTPLMWAAGNGHEAVVKLLLDKDGVDLNSKDSNGRTPLMWAAINGHEAVVKLLLDKDGVDLNSKNSNGRTPLTWAAVNGHEAVVKLLLDKDNVDLNSKDSDGWTPLMLAAWYGHEAVVKLLLDKGGIDLNSKDSNGRTLLMWAAGNGHKAVVKLLLDKGGIDLNSKDSDSWTPLMFAARNGHEAVVKLLLDKGGIDLNSKDSDSWTPLMWAARNGHEAVVKLLLDKDGVDLNSKDSNGRTLLMWAARNGHEAVVKLLLDKGCVDLNSKDTDR